MFAAFHLSCVRGYNNITYRHRSSFTEIASSEDFEHDIVIFGVKKKKTTTRDD